MTLNEEFKALTKTLIETTAARDAYDVEYELEKARMTMSAEVGAMSNQTMRDAKVTVLMEEKGMYRQSAVLKSKARLAWYEWSAVKSLIDGKEGS
jgi:hypothetical protein